MLLSNY